MKNTKLACLILGLLCAFVIFCMDVVVTSIAQSVADAKEQRNAATERSYRIPSPHYHHDLRPGIETQAAWGSIDYPVRTNSLGFRDRSPRAIAPAGDKKRLLFIGDSFTEGVGVAYDATFVGLIDAKLGATGYEVLNAAVSSYYPDLYLRKVRYLVDKVGLKFDELVVFIDISDIQDEVLQDEALQDKALNAGRSSASLVEAEAGAAPSALRIFFRERTILQRAIFVGLRRLLTGHEEPVSVLPNDVRSAWTIDRKFFDEYGKEGLALAEHHMDELARLLKQSGITLTVAVYPWPAQILARDLNSMQVTHWQAWAKRHGARFVNLFPLFIDGSDPREKVQTYFFEGDVHWNRDAHRVVAEHFLSATER